MAIVSGTWSTTDVNALLAGLIGVAATLLGSFTTYLFQSRTAERAYDTSACSPTNVILEHSQGLLVLTVTDLGE